MKKQDLIPIVLILALFLAYPTLDRKFVRKIFPPKAKPAPAAVAKAEAPPARRRGPGRARGGPSRPGARGGRRHLCHLEEVRTGPRPAEEEKTAKS
jgi:hypothetical protein